MSVVALLGDIGWPTWLALGSVVFVATIMQVGAGVGFGSVVGPGTMLLAPQLMPGPMLCLSLFASVLGAGRIGGSIAVREVALALAGRAAGAAAAGWLIVVIATPDMFAMAFAALTLLGVLSSVSGLRLEPTAPVLLVAGFLSGLMATVTTAGGPPIALVYQHQPPEKARATMNAYFALGIIPPLVALWTIGALDPTALARSMILLPAVGLGVAMSHRAARLIDRRFRLLLLAFCVVTVLIVAVRALLRMIG